jgi:hypothetical protein
MSDPYPQKISIPLEEAFFKAPVKNLAILSLSGGVDFHCRSNPSLRGPPERKTMNSWLQAAINQFQDKPHLLR